MDIKFSNANLTNEGAGISFVRSARSETEEFDANYFR